MRVCKNATGTQRLAVEVLSPDTAAHDRTEKLGWYRQYGVRECWLVNPAAGRVAVVDFAGAMPEREAPIRPVSCVRRCFPASPRRPRRSCP